MTSANELAALAERCREIREWQKTSILCDGEIRKLAKTMPVSDEHVALRLAESETAQQAMDYVIRAISAAGAREASGTPIICTCEECVDAADNNNSHSNSEWNAAVEVCAKTCERVGDEIMMRANAAHDEDDYEEYERLECAAAEYTTCASAIRSLHRGEAQRTDGGREPGFIKPDNDRQVFFYEQDFYVLSNFSAFNLKWANLTFPTSEHAYHYEKFLFSGEMRRLRPIREAIRGAPSAHEAFKIAENEKANRRPDWDYVKVPIMKRILGAKAEQHEYVRRKLLATGDRELIEDSWRDDFWGWGPNRDGQNILGKLWMQVRDELRTAPQTDGGEER